jgi:hypothetical protein
MTTQLEHDPDEATDMTRAQRIRADAVIVASQLLGDGITGTTDAIAAYLIELAEPIADWIRDGSRP